MPNAPNPLRLYGQTWDFNYVDTLRTEGGLNYSHDGWTVNAAVGYATTYNSYAGNFTSVGLESDGTYDSNLTQGNSSAYSVAYRAQLSKEFTIGPVTQTISLIADGSDHIFHYSVLNPLALGLSSLSNPVYVAQPNLPPAAPNLHNNIRLESEILSDKVDITRYVTLFVGGVRSAISNAEYGLPSHTSLANIYQNKITPIAALEVKPTANLTLYTSYIQALQPGSTAPSTAVNANQTLPPFIGDQYEVGVKAEVMPGLEINAAAFRIDQAYAYLSSANVYTENGTQTNQGFEVTAVGRVRPGLTIFGGATYVDARVSNATGSLNGNAALLVPSYRLNAYAEYDVPGISGLTVLGGAYYTSRIPVQQNSSANIAAGYPATIFAPGYVTFDVGAKYATRIGNTPVLIRAYLENALNERYWIVYGNPVEPGPPITGKLALSAFF